MVSIHRDFVKLKRNNSLKIGGLNLKRQEIRKYKKKIFSVKKDWSYFFLMWSKNSSHSKGNNLFFRLLQDLQHGTKFDFMLRPPRARGTT